MGENNLTLDVFDIHLSSNPQLLTRGDIYKDNKNVKSHKIQTEIKQKGK